MVYGGLRARGEAKLRVLGPTLDARRINAAALGLGTLRLGLLPITGGTT
jgi:hypothetical protein